MMYSKVNIGGKEIELCACASVNVCYMNVFHKDFLKEMSTDDGVGMDSMMRMAFIMAKFAELKTRKEVNRLNEDAYCDWLDQFTAGDLVLALPFIQAAYMQTTAPAVDAKKNNTEPSDS